MEGDAVVYSPEILVDAHADLEAVRKMVTAAMDAGNRQLADLLSALPRPRFRSAQVLATRRDVRAQAVKLARFGMRRPAERSALLPQPSRRRALRSGRGLV